MENETESMYIPDEMYLWLQAHGDPEQIVIEAVKKEILLYKK
jgi:hypothetical protein